MNKENLAVLAKIIIAVETGGQVYGKGRYNDYTPPFKNSNLEVTCTLGAGQFYGNQGRNLIKMIYLEDPDAFAKLDTANIKAMLSKDWVSLKWKPNSAEIKALVALINSPIGHQCQDELIAERCEVMVKACQDRYPKADEKAQMMYAEISHLGGASAARRIFDRCSDYSLDTIMASLVRDQSDTSSSNQVGDKKYWSRHVKCREFIDRYYIPEEKETKPMAVIIGSARIDENGNATGGKAGDQKQKSSDDWSGEVSKQNWYAHSKGWRLLRAKDAAVREKIARGMEIACANPNYSYDQSQNRDAWNYLKDKGFDMAKLDVPKETDCAQLVRLCMRYAGVKSDDFYTVTQRDKTMKTGQFNEYSDYNHTKISTHLLRGDILTTSPTKGHTVVVLTDGSKASEEPERKGATPTPTPTPTPSKPTKKDYIKEGQKQLNNLLAEQIKAKKFDALVVDGIVGKKTMANFIRGFQYAMNKSYKAGLEVDGIYGRMSKAAARNYPTRPNQVSYVVTVLEIGMLLNGIDPKGVEFPGSYGSGLKAATTKYFGYTEIKEPGWTKLFS